MTSSFGSSAPISKKHRWRPRALRPQPVPALRAAVGRPVGSGRLRRQEGRVSTVSVVPSSESPLPGCVKATCRSSSQAGTSGTECALSITRLAACSMPAREAKLWTERGPDPSEESSRQRWNPPMSRKIENRSDSCDGSGAVLRSMPPTCCGAVAMASHLSAPLTQDPPGKREGPGAR